MRQNEGRGVRSVSHLQALPFRDLTGKHAYEWFIRARSFEALLRRVIEPLERAHTGRLQILDLGTGVGWLAYRLALRGHDVAGLDLVTDDTALGAHHHYAGALLSAQAEFDRLPFADRSVDLVIFNAAFHYTSDAATTARETARVLADGGCAVIMDSPLYRDRTSGAAMTRDRERALGKPPIFDGEAAPISFLTYDDLASLEQSAGLRWDFHQPSYGARWGAKPWLARVRKQREPAQFKLIVGRRVAGS